MLKTDAEIAAFMKRFPKSLPNPSGKFNIELEDFSKVLPYEVTDVFGRTIIRGLLSDKNTLLNLSAFDAGFICLG